MDKQSHSVAVALFVHAVISDKRKAAKTDSFIFI